MHKLAEKLLGSWVVELTAAYLSDQRSMNGDKLFIKVAGIDDEAWSELLASFRDAESKIALYYHPIIRTIRKVNGFESYACGEHETSTWLRNNTPSGSVLLIFMNEASAEAQSLENIFTIDEARLLGTEGMEILYKLLAETYNVYDQERDALQQFFILFHRLAEPQLRNVLSFLASIVQSDKASMVDKIQMNLDQLLLFRDRKLSLRSGEGYARLKRNFQLSRLEREGRAAKSEEYVDNLYSFLSKTAPENGGHELWEQDGVDQDTFRKHALDFIYNQSTELLRYEFEHVEAALSFRAEKETFQTRFNQFKEQSEIQSAWTPERQRIAAEMLEAIQEQRNPEAVDLFRQEFVDELSGSPQFSKTIDNKWNRLMQVSEYSELHEALLREACLMLEDQLGQPSLTEEAIFALRVDEAQVNEQTAAALRFHLHQLERLTGYVRFDPSSMPEITAKEKSKDISFRLTLLTNGTGSGPSTKFKLIGAFSGALPEMLEYVADNGSIPYMQQFVGDERRTLDVCGQVEEYMNVLDNAEMKASAQSFYAFAAEYTKLIQNALNDGMGSIDYSELEDRLAFLLRNSSANALAAKHIYQKIGLFGTLDRYQRKASESVGEAKERVLTLLNPIRLLSYAHRLMRLREEIGSRLRSCSEFSLGEQLHDYLQYVLEAVEPLSPRYFAVEAASESYLIEQQERMGEGEFVLNGKGGGEAHFADTFADEFLATVRTYLDVYPYAEDCLDLVFLYCPHAEYVTTGIDRLFKDTNTRVRKVKAIVHSAVNGAAIHDRLNAWVNQNERYTENHYGFPRVEVQVIAESSINEMMKTVKQYLQDADIGVLINYFGQSSHIKHRMEKVDVADTDSWFGTIYKEPLKQGDAVKRISLVSEQLPRALQCFYQLQAVVNRNEAIAPNEHYLLRHLVSVNDQADSALIDYMHAHFNWSFFVDRYLDKSLLRHVSAKAQIIKYKSQVGKNKRWRTLLSSSHYIRKLAEHRVDHAYYDRLHQKYRQLLKNENISKQAIVDATERVQKISGGIVLRAIGPGKFAHELMAIYLATQARADQGGELAVWSSCDELPWFSSTSRRPDLVRTSIRRADDRIQLHFELIELKFISHTIFETERFDATKQVKAGLELYRSRFLFGGRSGSDELWRQELVHYLLEYGTYSVEEALLLKQLQDIPIRDIDASVTCSIDTFVYTSNMQDWSLMEGHKGGYKADLLHNEYTNHIYNRAYILNALGAVQEPDASVPEYTELQEWKGFVADRLGLSLEESEADTSSQPMDSAPEYVHEHRYTPVFADEQFMAAEAAPTAEQPDRKTPPTSEAGNGFPELLALQGVLAEQIEQQTDISQLVLDYQRKLRFNFNQLGIPITIVDSFVGVSVIRLVIEIPADKSYSAIESRAKDIYLWLRLSDMPLIALRNGRINIDINRETPETVYFQSFMQLVRDQYPADKLRGRLIAPIGVGQLRELIAMDFSSSNTPHLLVGGTTGSGKSVTINSIILALMCLYPPSEVQFIFIDPKKVEFLVYEDRTHTKQVITEIEEAIRALEQLVEEMETRYRQFARESVASIDEYVEVTGGTMPRLIMVFDEFADFMEREKSLSSRVENAILRLGAKARASGIHLLICTQTPKADIVPTNIRNNLPARLALKAADHHASKIIINEEGAEKLGGKGDFLMKLDRPETVRAKSPFLTPNVKRALLKYFENGEQRQHRGKG